MVFPPLTARPACRARPPGLILRESAARGYASGTAPDCSNRPVQAGAADGTMGTTDRSRVSLAAHPGTLGDPVLGRQILMESLIAQDVSHIFGNPGTTESPIIDSLLDYPQLNYIEALHEGVAVGAASYYAQASGKTGLVNLHVAPGLGNAIGMMYNALKASAPIIVTAGQQDTRMRLRDPLLGHDRVAISAPVTKWSVQAERADELPLLLHRAFKVANDPPAGPVFVALPIDVLEQESQNEPMAPGRLYRAGPAAPAGVAEAAALLAGRQNPVIVVGDEVARFGAGAEVVALAEALGAAIWTEGIRMHASVPSNHPNFRLALGFDTLAIRKALEGADAILLVGGPFFEEVW